MVPYGTMLSDFIYKNNLSESDYDIFGWVGGNLDDYRIVYYEIDQSTQKLEICVDILNKETQQ